MSIVGANHKRIFWVDHTRFDLKLDKSTWLEVSEALIERGHDVSILSGYGTSKYYPKGYKVNMIYFRALDLGGVFRISLLLNILCWLLRKTAKEDIIILHPNSLVIAPFLRLFGKNNIHLDIRTVPVNIDSLRDHIDRWLFWKIPLSFLRNLATGNSFITDRLRLAVEKEFNVKFEDYVLWESGVNSKRFKITDQVTTKKGSDEFVLFYHGFISEKRGIGYVVKAIAELDERYRKHISFIVIGTGPGLAGLKELADRERISDRIVFKGFLPHEDIPREIWKADCCVCPLPDRPEWNVSSPLKVFEYMACGKPMILTPIPAHIDVLKGEDFIVWTKGETVEDFRRAIEYAYDHRVKLAKDSTKASELASQNYDWAVKGRKFADYLSRKFSV
jgi:glycosyltransferase involved in cell wall biosynthesis